MTKVAIHVQMSKFRKKPDGTYEGIIVETRSLPGAEKTSYLP